MEHERTSQSRPGLWHYPAQPTDGARRDRLLAQGQARADQRATALGWFGIGLGMVALLVPRAVAQAIGVPGAPTLLRLIGMRELVCGIGRLNQGSAPVWRWSRLVGTAMDLSLLGIAARRPDVRRQRLTATAFAVAGVAALDLMASNRRGNDT